MQKKALIMQGGWEGHRPKEIAALFKRMMEECDFDVEVSDTLKVLEDSHKLQGLDLIIPVWTAGKISHEQIHPLLDAVANGLGLAGIHGMADGFRECIEWQFLTGGQFVSHPGDDHVEYKVHIKQESNPIVDGIEDFTIKSEQYYMHIDPAVTVLATTRFPVANGFHTTNGTVDMPVAWTKQWGKGRVFYCSLGHTETIVETDPVKTIIRRGFVWASR